MSDENPWHIFADELVEIGEKLSDVRNGLKELRRENPVPGRPYARVVRVQEIKRAAKRVITLLTAVEDVFRDVARKQEEQERIAKFKPERSPQ